MKKLTVKKQVKPKLKVVENKKQPQILFKVKKNEPHQDQKSFPHPFSKFIKIHKPADAYLNVRSVNFKMPRRKVA